MLVDIQVPSYGVAMEEAVLVRWLVSIGDQVMEGESVAEIETDKVTVEITSPANGFMAEMLAEPDDTLDVGGVIARVETQQG